jgi:hypothetical protein
MVRITPKSTQHTGMSTSPEGSIAALGKRFRRLVGRESIETIGGIGPIPMPRCSLP